MVHMLTSQRREEVLVGSDVADRMNRVSNSEVNNENMSIDANYAKN